VQEEGSVVVNAYGLKDRIAAALLAAAALGGIGAASAQDESAALSACAAPHCLGVDFAPELRAALAGEAKTTIEALAAGLVLSYRGEGPIDVRLVAVRYDDGRLVRYGVSDRTRLEPGSGLLVADAGGAIARALTPATHRIAEVSAFDGGEAVAVALPAFVGAVPPTNLAGEPGLVALAGALEGSIGVIALEPEDPALRDGMAAESYGVVVRLEMIRP
jgi:hypothetical protein